MRQIAVLFFSLTVFHVSAQDLKVVLPVGHTAAIKDVVITPDGKKAITSGADNKVIIWDLNRGLELKTLQSGGQEVEQLLFNTQGTRLLGAKKYGRKDSIPLWDLSTGNLIAWLKHARDITAAEFFPDGKKILTAGFMKSVKIWNAESGQLEKEFDAGDLLIWSAHVTPDGKHILVALGDEAGIWNAESGEKIQSFKGHTEMVNEIAISPDGKWIATTSNDKTTKIWNAASGTLAHTLKHSENGDNLSFNSTSRSLLVKTTDIGSSALELFEVETGKKIKTLVDGKKEASIGIFSPDGAMVVTGSEDTVSTVWDAHTGKQIFVLNKQYGGMSHAVFSSDGSKLFTTSNYTQVWDMRNGALLQQLRSEGYGFFTSTVSGDGSIMIAAENDAAVVWNIRRDVKEFALKGNTQTIERFSYTPDKKFLITNNSNSSFTRLWDLRTGDMLLNKFYVQPALERVIFTGSCTKALVDYKYPRSPELYDLTTGIAITIPDGGDPTIRWTFSKDEKYLATADIENIVKIWEVETGRLMQTLDGKMTETADDILFTDDSKRLIVTDLKENLYLWDVNGKLLNKTEAFHKRVDDLMLIDGTDWMLSDDYNGGLKLWDTKTGKLKFNLKGHQKSIRKYMLVNNKQQLLTLGFNERSMKIWDLSTGNLATELKTGAEIGDLELTADGNYLVAASNWEPEIRVWDTRNWKLLHTLPGHEKYTTEMIVTPDNHLFTRSAFDKKVLYWDLAAGKLEKVIGHAELPNTFAYDATSKWLMVGGESVVVWDISNFTLKTTLPSEGADIKGLAAGIRQGTILTGSSDNQVRLWDVEKQVVLQKFFSVDNSEYFTSVDNDYYKSSPGAAKKLHYVTPALEPVSFQQLDIKYNRPDIVLQRAGSTDTALISSYRKAYEKRVKKLGIDTVALKTGNNFPSLEIIGSKELPLENTTGKVEIRIRASDNKNQLKTFNVWINDNPLFGIRGKSITGKRTTFDTTILLQLSDGQNLIEATVTNDKGLESFPTPVNMVYRPAQPSTEKVYFIGIGINRFADSTNNLQYSVKDIRDLAKAMAFKYDGKIEIDTLFDEQVTASNIRRLKEKLATTSVNDKVIISYSGHGLLSKDLDYYLSTYDVNFKKPEQNGLPYEEMERLLDSIPARKKLMLIDACHSGELDKEELARYDFVEKNVADTGAKSNRKPVAKEARLGMKSSFELMQELFVNVGKNTGAIIISAAGGTQFALEKGALQNGVFTYAVLEFMDMSYSSTPVSALKNFVNMRVTELTNGLQVPTTRSETKAVDWKVW